MPLPNLGRHSATVAQASRFATVGAINTLVDLGLFSLFFYVLAWPLLLANAGGFVVAVAGSYLLNKSWTFADSRRGWPAIRQGAAFLVVATGGLAIGSLVIWLAAMAVPPIVAKLTSIGATFVWNFLMSRRLVFKVQSPAKTGKT